MGWAPRWGRWGRGARTLRDAPRPGTPPTFTALQVIGIVKLACTPPEEADGPCSQWGRATWRTRRSGRESWARSRPAQWGVFEKEAALQPHRSRYWLTPPVERETFEREVQVVCDCDHAAPALAAQGVRTVSTDEKPMHVLERAHPGLPLVPGHVARRAFE